MKKVLKTILNVIIWIFVIFALAAVILTFSAQANNDGVPALFGKSLISVQSDSMVPEFSKGDMIIDKTLTEKEKANLDVDDVITFITDLDGNGQDEFNTHRIISKKMVDNATVYTTKGDNNLVQDSTEVRYDMVVGKYTGTKIGGLGTVINFLQTRTGFLIVIVIPLALFFIYELYNFIKVIIASKGAKTQEEEDEIKKKAVEEFLKQQEAAKVAEATEANKEADEVKAEKVDEEKDASKTDE